MKTRLITWFITLSAVIDQVYAVLSDNSGVLAELGVSPKVTKIIMLLGFLWTAFSKSLTHKNEVRSIVGGNVPPSKDEK